MSVLNLQDAPALLVCGFSPDGEYIAAGSNDCLSYVWHWDASSRQAWKAPAELCKLTGHRNDVVLLQFSHDGLSIATGSRDGTVRVCFYAF